MKIHYPVHKNPDQRGAALVISLIMLLVLTLIGISSMNGTITEERMASNTRDRSLAFQSAEEALRASEAFIGGSATLAAVNATQGAYSLASSEPAYTASTWTGTNSFQFPNTPYGVNAAPRAVIKHITTVNTTSTQLNVPGYGSFRSGNNVAVFKITAHGTGASSDGAEVMLRSFYGKIF